MIAQPKLLRFAACAALAVIHAVKCDLVIYTDGALASGWEDWSWSSDINYAATDEFAGTSGSSISVNSTEWAALSVKYEGTFPSYAGLRFDIAVRFSHHILVNSSPGTVSFLLCRVQTLTSRFLFNPLVTVTHLQTLFYPPLATLSLMGPSLHF